MKFIRETAAKAKAWWDKLPPEKQRLRITAVAYFFFGYALGYLAR